MTRKGREKTMTSKSYCFHKEPRKGPCLMFAVTKSQSLCLHLLLLQDSVNQETHESSWGGVPGRGDDFVQALPRLLPEQLKNSDATLWFYSKHPCSCGHGALSVSESDSE